MSESFPILKILFMQVWCPLSTKNIANFRQTSVYNISLQTNLNSTNILLTLRYGSKRSVVTFSNFCAFSNTGIQFFGKDLFANTLLILEKVRSSNDLPPFLRPIQKSLMFPLCAFRNFLHNCKIINFLPYSLFTIMKKQDFYVSMNIRTRIYRKQY